MDGNRPSVCKYVALGRQTAQKGQFCKEMFSNAVTDTVMLLSLIVDLQPNERNAVAFAYHT